MSIAKRAVNNIFWLFISQICARGLTFLGTLYLARVLGVAGFGLYSLAIAVAMYMWAIVDMGVAGYGTREVARDTSKTEELLKVLNSLKIVVAIAVFLLLCGILFTLKLSSQTRWTLLAGGLYVIAFALSPDWVLRGVERMEYIALGNLVMGISFLGGIYLLVKSPADTTFATFYRSLAFLLGSFVTLIALKKKVGIGFSLVFAPKKWWAHIKESWYFAVDNGLNVIGRYIPFFFLGIWATTKELGLFSAPHRFILLIISIAMIIPVASYPILSSLYLTEKDKFQATHRSLQKLALYLGLPMGVLGMLLGEDIIRLLYGSKYLGAAGILKIMIWVIPLIFLRLDYSRPLISAGFQDINMFANLSGTGATILFCLLLIPSYGSYGAAFAIVGGELITLIIMSLMFKRKLYRSSLFDYYFAKVALASIVTGIVISKIEFPILLKIISSIAIYGVLSLLFGIIKKESITAILQMFQLGKRTSKTPNNKQRPKEKQYLC